MHRLRIFFVLAAVLGKKIISRCYALQPPHNEHPPCNLICLLVTRPQTSLRRASGKPTATSCAAPRTCPCHTPRQWARLRTPSFARSDNPTPITSRTRTGNKNNGSTNGSNRAVTCRASVRARRHVRARCPHPATTPKCTATRENIC